MSDDSKATKDVFPDARDLKIAELIALQTIVYIDETGWEVGDKSCYTWIFSTSMHVLFRCDLHQSSAGDVQYIWLVEANFSVIDRVGCNRRIDHRGDPWPCVAERPRVAGVISIEVFRIQQA